MRWHYIPYSKFEYKQLDLNSVLEKAEKRGITVYLNTRTSTGRVASAFLPKEEQDVNFVLELFGLKNAVWTTNTYSELVLRRAEALPIPELSSMQLEERFISAMESAKDKQKRDVQRLLDNSKSNAAMYLQSLTASYESIRQYEVQLESFEQNDKEQLLSQLRAIRKLEAVEKINIINTQLQVFTRPLEIHGVNFGRYTLTFDLGTVRVKDIQNENPVKYSSYTYHHPHVQPGYICWGNAAGAIADLQSKGDVLRLVALTIDFLTSFNPKDVTRDGHASQYVGVFNTFKDRQKKPEKEGKKPRATARTAAARVRARARARAA